ncbi:hypothetical protein MTO96_014227 [Rhipicephalus appendiculatus]
MWIVDFTHEQETAQDIIRRFWKCTEVFSLLQDVDRGLRLGTTKGQRTLSIISESAHRFTNYSKMWIKDFTHEQEPPKDIIHCFGKCTEVCRLLHLWIEDFTHEQEPPKDVIYHF